MFRSARSRKQVVSLNQSSHLSIGRLLWLNTVLRLRSVAGSLGRLKTSKRAFMNICWCFAHSCGIARRSNPLPCCMGSSTWINRSRRTIPTLQRLDLRPIVYYYCTSVAIVIHKSDHCTATRLATLDHSGTFSIIKFGLAASQITALPL